jgi:cell division protease FtsH
MDQEKRFNLLFVMLALFGVLILHNAWEGVTQIETIPYSRFLELLDQDRISELYVADKTISGTIRDPHKDEKRQFVTVRVDDKLAGRIVGKDIKMTGVVQSTFLRDLLSWVVPTLIFVGIWVVAMRYFVKKGGMGGSFMTVGKSKAKVYVETDTKKSFKDVAGADEAKDELIEVVNFLKNPESYGRLGARMPKGILLVGPPGTGKTLLARAVAGEAGVPFFSISGSEFVEMFVGVGAARVRDLFEQARTKSPCIIFIDELDALGKARAGASFPGHDEKEQTLNQLLVEMDGFDSSTGIVLLAATNRPEVLDPALLRAGRFDRHVLLDRPDKTGRIAILKVHLKNIKKIDSALDLDAIAAMSTGFSGADLENLVNEAALVATRRNGQQVTTSDFNAAIERIVAGLERKNRVLNEMEREVVAYHEMGHAIVGAGLRISEKLHKVSIIPRGIGALGYTIQRPTEDRYLMTKEELENKIAVLFGGRAAEEIIFDHFSTGAADDISKATNIARSMVRKYGMNEKLGFVDLEEGSGEGFLGGGLPALSRAVSEETAREIDVAVREIISTSYNRARQLLENNRSILETSARTLLEKETLDENELEAILKNLVRTINGPNAS